MHQDQMVVFSFGALVSCVFATGKIVSLVSKNKLIGIGVLVVLLFLIPASSGKQFSTFTMQMAYQFCKKMDMEKYRMNVYNGMSVIIGYLPWLIVDMLSPKKEPKSKKSRKREVAK